MMGVGRGGQWDLFPRARSNSVVAGWVDCPRLAVSDQLFGTSE